jgi:hypothetical protein
MAQPNDLIQDRNIAGEPMKYCGSDIMFSKEFEDRKLRPS